MEHIAREGFRYGRRSPFFRRFLEQAPGAPPETDDKIVSSNKENIPRVNFAHELAV